MKTTTKIDWPEATALEAQRDKEIIEGIGDEERKAIYSLPKKLQKKAMYVIAGQKTGNNVREQWVNGLIQAKKMIKSPDHFIFLLLDERTAEATDLFNLMLNVELGKHESEANTDPRLYKILHDSLSIFKQRNFHKTDYKGVINFMADHPEKRAKMKEPTKMLAKAIVNARLHKNITRAELAKACKISERTIANLESGKTVTSTTLLTAMQKLKLLKNFTITDNSSRNRASRKPKISSGA